MSSSVVRLTASSKAKLGAAVNVLGVRASCCIQRAGFCMNAIGLISTVGRPSRIAEEHPDDQAHVVVEAAARTRPWCPTGAPSGTPRRSPGAICSMLLGDVLVSDDHTGRGARRPRRVLQVGRPWAARRRARASRGESKSSVSTSMNFRARCLACLAVLADVVDDVRGGQHRDRGGVLHRAGDRARRAGANCGIDSGTAMKPAWMAPRNATT